MRPNNESQRYQFSVSGANRFLEIVPRGSLPSTLTGRDQILDEAQRNPVYFYAAEAGD